MKEISKSNKKLNQKDLEDLIEWAKEEIIEYEEFILICKNKIKKLTK